MDISLFLPKTELFKRKIEISVYLATKLINRSIELVLA